jgi:hypothetical protein
VKAKIEDYGRSLQVSIELSDRDDLETCLKWLPLLRPLYTDFPKPAQEAVMPSNSEIEQEIQDKGLTAPRVTPQQIEDEIAEEYSFTANNAVKGTPGESSPSLKLLTICVLVLRNGFTVTGESACASPENFDAELGHKIARQHAKDKIWALEGYALKKTLAAQKKAA